MGSTPRMPSVSNEQFHIMLDYMEMNPDLFFGKVTETFTAQIKRALWNEIAEKLNNTENGCHKTIGKWIQTWNLWKIAVKRRAVTIEKYQIKRAKLPVSLKVLSEVEERCYALILSNDHSYDSDDDCSKEAADTVQRNSVEERMDDTATQTMDTSEARQESQIKTNNSPDMSKNNSSLLVLEDSSYSEKKPIIGGIIEDSTEASTSDDSRPKGSRPAVTLRYSALPRYEYTPVAKMRLSLAKRMRLSSAKRMRLSAPEKTKISGSRKMKATTADRKKRRASEKMTGYAFNKLQEYVSETVKKSAAEKTLKYASEKMNPRVEIIKGYASAKKIESPHEEKQSSAETDFSKERVAQQKNRNSVSEQMAFAEERIQNSEPENAMDVEPNESNKAEKMSDVAPECVHRTLSEDWKNALVEELKALFSENMTDVIAEKIRDALSDRVQNDIPMKLKDAMSKLPKDSVAESNKNDTIVPMKGIGSAEVANTTDSNDMNSVCSIQITDIRSINNADGLIKLDKKPEELEGTSTVVAEGHKRSERSVKSRDKTTANERCVFSERADIKIEGFDMDALEKGKRMGHDEESSSDEEIFIRPPSKKRIKYTENVVGELRLLQSSRLERLDSINRTLKSNVCAMVVLSKTIDNNTDAINNLAKAINNAGSLFLTSFD